MPGVQARQPGAADFKSLQCREFNDLQRSFQNGSADCGRDVLVFAQLRHAVGLRDLRAQTGAKAAKSTKGAKPIFKQYREADGKFYFKLVDTDGRLLLQSLGFESPKDAGKTIDQLQTQGASALSALAEKLEPLTAESTQSIDDALQRMQDAD